MKTINIKIDKKTGKITISTSGYTGDECLKATDQLEKGLGLEGPVEHTDEFFAEETNNQQLGQ